MGNSKRLSEDCWIPPGKMIEVGRIKIPGGMLYVGHGLEAVSGRDVEPALIDPSLSIDLHSTDPVEATLGYWPSFSNIEANCRGAYLEWLKAGRSNPNADIGYVFLFLYGLERRVLHDLFKKPGSSSEIEAIAAEVKRLLSIYGGNRSFQGYANRLLGFIRSLSLLTGKDVSPPGPSGRSYELPLNVRVALGRFASEGKALPADWAFAWVMGDPESPIRTPATRCGDEFKDLFLIRYRAQFGDGIALVPVCKRHIKVDYRPASSSFGGSITLAFELPDVATLVRPKRMLHGLVEECCAALEGYSRWIVRKPGERGSLSAAAYLPEELLAPYGPKDFASFQERIDQQLAGKGMAIMEADHMLQTWLADDQRVSEKEFGEIALILRKLGFGIEPDPRFSGERITAGDKVALFRLTKDSPEVASSEYGAAALLLRLAVAVAFADGDVAREEEERLREHLTRSLQLGRSEEIRLRAYLARLIAQPPRLTGLKRQLELFSPERREAIGRFLVDVAWSDGRIEPEEVKLLAKIFRLLGLDPAKVHAEIHEVRGSTATSRGPVTIQEAHKAREYGIPESSEASAPKADREIRLDLNAVQAKLKESAAVSALLSSVFAEAPEKGEPPRGEEAAGLDSAHTLLLRRLGGQPSWTREGFEALAAELGLLPDGALERINDAAIEKCDRTLAEADETIELDPEVYEEMLKR